ncbi:Auxin-responsive protein, partial [Melia azedarach]
DSAHSTSSIYTHTFGVIRKPSLQTLSSIFFLYKEPSQFFLLVFTYQQTITGVRLPIAAKQILRRTVLRGNKASSTSLDVPKGFFAVYVGEAQKKRFVVSVSFLKKPSFQALLSKAEEEFGYDHPMGGLTIPCREDILINVTSHLSKS